MIFSKLIPWLIPVAVRKVAARCFSLPDSPECGRKSNVSKT
jgi:hypothetical protein